MKSGRYNAGMHRLVALLVLLTTVSLMAPRPAHACSCAMPPTPAVGFTQADAIFSGTVSQLNLGSALGRLLEPVRQWLGLAPAPSAYNQFAVVAVSQSWKGVRHSPVQVQTDGGAMCGFPFVSGQRYLIYAHASGGGLSATICSRTAELGLAGTDLAYLRTLPALVVTQSPPGAGWVWTALGAGAAGLMLLAGVALALRRRARRAARSHEV